MWHLQHAVREAVQAERTCIKFTGSVMGMGNSGWSAMLEGAG